MRQLAACSIASLLLAAAPLAQQARFKSGVDLVTVDVAVLNASGQPTVLSDAARQKLDRYQSVLWFLANVPYWMKLEKKGLWD